MTTVAELPWFISCHWAPFARSIVSVLVESSQLTSCNQTPVVQPVARHSFTELPLLISYIWIPVIQPVARLTELFWATFYKVTQAAQCGPGSVVGIATGYRLDGPGIESRWGQDFPHLSRPLWGPPSLLYSGYRVFPRGKEQPGHDTDPSPPSSAVGHERVELYFYSPYGPYGLYRASVPVQGCTLPLPLQATQSLASLYTDSALL